MRPIPGFDMYAVTEDGRVFRIKPGPRQIGQKFPREIAPQSRWGYELFQLWKGGKLYRRYGHELVLCTYVGPRPDGHVCAHGDGNRRNNNVANLRWATQAENQADRKLHGTEIRGETHYHAKLTDKEVDEIRAAPRYRGVCRDLASQYGVAPQTIGKIRNYLRRVKPTPRSMQVSA